MQPKGWLIFARTAALFILCLYFNILSPSGAQAQTINQYTNSTSGAINDVTCGTAGIVTRTFTVSNSYMVTDVDIGIALTHTYRSDLRITLTSPAGTVVQVMTNVAGSGDNLHDLFNDAAAANISTHNATVTDPTTAAPPYSHSFQPTSVLSAFNGQNANGTWTLNICDSAAADVGVFTRADLYITQRNAGTAPTLVCPVGTSLLDWNAQSWTSGSATGTANVTNVGAINFGVVNQGAYVTPLGKSSVLLGGLAATEQALYQNVDFATNTQTITTTMTLPTAVPGMQFKLFDIDYAAAAFADKVTVSGTFGGVSITPTLTQGLTNTVSGTSAIGDLAAGDASGDGNVIVTFAGPVDTVVITYSNHTTAPANPTAQAMSIHDFTFCNPKATVSATKTSSVVSDGISATNPKAIPGATILYCITFTNSGSATTTNVAATDTIPSNLTYVPGSMKSGTSCATATTAEDDNATGADESDPYGASITGSTITATAASMLPNNTLAIVFNATVN